MIAAMAVLVLTMGCGGGADEASQGAANHVGEAKQAVETAYGDAEKAVDEMVADGEQIVNAAVTATNTLTGTSGCGHCDFKLGDSCSAAMKTADGKIYVLDGVDPESELFKERMKGHEITVKGEIQIVDGQPHMEVGSFHM
jgi:hypothetical protein